MEKVWATDIRDACKKSNVPFFFKQWGEFGEDGTKIGKKPKKDGLTPPTLDGVIHNAYPGEKREKPATKRRGRPKKARTSPSSEDAAPKDTATKAKTD